MQQTQEENKIKDRLMLAVIVLLCAATVILDFLQISYVADEFRNRMISKIIQQLAGSLAAILLMIRSKIRLFGKPQNWLYMIPCLLIAIDNFQFSSFFNGRMELERSQPIDFILFAGYCLAVGTFEECIFRGIIFAVLAGCFSGDKKGFLQTYVVSSLIFAGAHLFNVFAGAGIGATLLQVGYTLLTGGLFGFALIKTKNVFCAALTHAVYNFCGLLFDKTQGLGTGIVFDMGTVVTMIVVSVVIGAFILYKVYTYPEEERLELYARLGVKEKKQKIEEK